MRIRRQYTRIATGVLVLVMGAVFVVFAFVGSGLKQADGYQIHAVFNNIDGLVIGDAVHLAGLRVGTVTGQALDLDTLQAVVTMTIDSGVVLSTDTSAAIISESLLGGKYIRLDPGGDETTIEPGGQIVYSQDSIILEELLEKIVLRAEAARKSSSSPPE